MKPLMLPLVISTVLIAVGSSSAHAECPEISEDRTICEFASDAAERMAFSLPQQISANMTLEQVYAVENHIWMTVTLNYSESDLNRSVEAAGSTRGMVDNTMETNTKNWLCSAPDLSAFIEFGGAIGYNYRFIDGQRYLSIEVDSCS